MFKRLVFTLDPDYFPPKKMREIVANLHSKNQRYSRLFMFLTEVSLHSTFSYDGRSGCGRSPYRFWYL